MTKLSDAEAHRHQEHPDHRRRPDRDRPGLRVRLFRRAGLQGAEGGGLPRHPGQLEPGDDHDRSRAGRRDLYRADHARHRRSASSRRSGRTRCCRPWAARPRSTPRWRWSRTGALEQLRRRADRRQARRHRQGRGPQLFRDAMDRDRPRTRPRAGSCASLDEALAALPSVGLPAIIRPSFTLGGTGGGIAYNKRGIRGHRRAAACAPRRPAKC